MTVRKLFYNDEEWALLQIRRGVTNRRPTLWLCSGCGYSFWSYGDSQDPIGDGHCSNGYWLADFKAIDLIAMNVK